MKNAIPFQLILIAASLVLVVFLALRDNPPTEEPTVMYVETDDGVHVIRPARTRRTPVEGGDVVGIDDEEQDDRPATTGAAAPARGDRGRGEAVQPPADRTRPTQNGVEAGRMEQQLETTYDAGTPETVY